MANPDSLRLRRRLTAAGLAFVIGAVAGCSPDSAPESPTDQVVQTVAVTNEAVDMADIGSDIESAQKTREDISRLGAQVVGLSKIYTMIDYRVAEQAVYDSGYGLDKARTDLSLIENEEIRKQAERAIDYAVAEDVLNTAEYDLQSAIKLLETIKSEQIREQARQALDAFIASDAISTAEYDLDGAEEAISHISDPKVKNQAREVLNVMVVNQALVDVKYGYISRKKTIELINKISNARTRELAMECLRAAVVSSLPLGDVEYFGRSEIDSNANKSEFSLWEKSNDAANTLSDGEEAARIGAAKELSEYLAAFNGNKRLSKKIKIDELAKPEATIDLTNMHGSKEIPNVMYTGLGSEESEYINQFAEVFSNDGKLEIRFEEDNGLSEETKSTLSRLVANIKPLIEAAFASGSLYTIRFTESDIYSPYYAPSAREINFVLPKSDDVSEDQLRGGLIHEIAHALTRDIFNNEDVSGKEKEQIVNTCSSIKRTLYKRLEDTFNAIPAYFEGVQKDAKKKHKPIFKKIAQILKHKDLSELLSVEYASVDYNDCLYNGLGGLISQVADELKIELEEGSLDYLKEKDSYRYLGSFWDDIVRKYSVYSVFNEARYAKTNETSKEYLGHTEDEARELLASTLVVLISYPGEFISSVRELKTEGEKRAALQAAYLTLDTVGRRNPSLKHYLDVIEQYIRAGTAKSIRIK